MIITLIFQALLGIVNLFVALLPTIELNFDIGSHLGTVAQYVGYLDTFVSLSTIGYCISAILVVDNFGLILKIINFIWNKIPFIN